MSARPDPVEVYCSYAPKDEKWFLELKLYLDPMQREGLISLWSSHFIDPGSHGDQEIDRHLKAASIILLLVSPDFLASDDLLEAEVQPALERQEAGEARVIPILIRSSGWMDAPFAHLAALPANGQPLANARNKDTALTEVAARLRKIITEMLQQRPAGTARASEPRHWHVPFPRNRYFVGRENELARLHQQFSDTSDGQIQVISGLGGSGKTSLALEYAYRFRGQYTVVLWASADNEDSLNASYTEIAHQLNLPLKGQQGPGDIADAIKIWLRTHWNYLLVLDNADDLEQLMSLIMRDIGGHQLITTRSSATRFLHSPQVDLQTLPDKQGATLLLQRSGLLARNVPEDREQARLLSQELGGLPLALEQAGAYLEETGTSVAAYRHLYQQHRLRLFNEDKLLDYPRTVATTWQISFQKIEEKKPAALDLLRLCAFLAPDAIPETIFTQGAAALGPILAPVGADQLLLDKAWIVLRFYSFIQRDPHQQTLTIHRLVQGVMRDNLGRTEQRTWAERAVGALNSVIPESQSRYWQEWQRYMPHIMICSHWIDEYNLISHEAGQLLTRTGTMLRHFKRHPEAERMYEQALHIYEQLVGPEAPETTATLDNLATIIGIQKRFEEALPLYQRALAIRERILGPDHPDTASTLNGMALLYTNWHRYDKAERLYERVVHIYEQTTGPDSLETATALNNLGSHYRHQKKYEQAQPLFERALRIREQVLGPVHEITAISVYSLAHHYRFQDRHEEALPFFKQALSIYKHALGPTHAETATAVNNLALAYTNLKEYEQAQSLYERALHLREQIFGEEHAQTALTRLNMAEMFRKMKDYKRAESVLWHALRTHEQALGEEHWVFVRTLKEYAALLHEMGRDEEAQQLEARIPPGTR